MGGGGFSDRAGFFGGGIRSDIFLRIPPSGGGGDQKFPPPKENFRLWRLYFQFFDCAALDSEKIGCGVFENFAL